MPSRPLTDHEREIRDDRGRKHVASVREAPAMLAELRARLELHGESEHGQASSWVVELEAHLHIARDDPDPLAIVWWVARLGHWFGAWMIERFGGHWYLDENADGQTFLRSVVGAFGLEAAAVDVGADAPRYDPFRIAATVFAEHVSVASVLEGIQRELGEGSGSEESGAT